MTENRPTCTILAGPNGAGKSSIFSKIAGNSQFINADVVARELNESNPEKVALEAGRIIIRQLDDAFKLAADFTYETTLSSRQSLQVLRRARQLNYQTLVLFVTLDSSDLHVKRVEQRVRSGGHHIPEHVVRRRYEHAFKNLALAIPNSDATMIFDNSGATGPELLVMIEAGVVKNNRLKAWRHLDHRIAIAVANGLGMPAKQLLS